MNFIYKKNEGEREKRRGEKEREDRSSYVHPLRSVTFVGCKTDSRFRFLERLFSLDNARINNNDMRTNDRCDANRLYDSLSSFSIILT